MKIAFITAFTPYEKGETFILEELLYLEEIGVDFIVIPRNPKPTIFHKKAFKLLNKTLYYPLFNFQILFVFFLSLFSYKIWKLIFILVKNSGLNKIVLKNLAVLPKSVFLSKILPKMRCAHIHAYWGGTTASMAWMLSYLTKIPFSFTVYRWDIKENNILKLKVKECAFLRCTSEDGKKDLVKIVGNNYTEKIVQINIGVRIPESINVINTHPPLHIDKNKILNIFTPANLLPVKGHKYMIESCVILKKNGFDKFKWFIIGDGPIENELKEMVREKNLTNEVIFTGRLPHEELLERYKRKEVHIVVLPSVTTQDGEKEGTPTALMEAMAWGIPTISTNIGGIPEVIAGGAGLLVPEKDPQALANAISFIVNNPDKVKEIIVTAYNKVKEKFDIHLNMQKFIKLINSHSKERYSYK